MKTALVPALVAALLATAPAAANSSNILILGQPNDANIFTADIVGNDNVLTILQEHEGGGSNTIDISIEGDLNGGPAGSSFSGAAAFAGLTPGQISQRGHDNAMTIGVEGLGNLFAFSQDGSHNALTASIIGNYNQAAVSQIGMGNVVNFSQVGNGNMLSVVQRSW